jgi:FkbM family methyltransferase
MVDDDARIHRQSLANRVAAHPHLVPTPGWVLGGGQNATLAMRLRKIVWRQLRKPFPGVARGLADLSLSRQRNQPRNFRYRRLRPKRTFPSLQAIKTRDDFHRCRREHGLYTVFAAQKVGSRGRVLSVEPSQRELGILRNNIYLNGLENVTVFPLALSNREEDLELLVAPIEKSGHNTLGAFGFDTRLDHKERVRSVTLDSLVQEQQLRRVDIIKMDIEGGEEAALRGARETIDQYHPLLFLELSHRSLQHQNSSAASLLALLSDYGYRVHGYESSTGLPSSEPRPCSEENIVAVYGNQRLW